MTHWTEAEWGACTLGSARLPGSWEVDAEAARDIDIKTQKDRDGAIIKDKGYKNADITLVGTIANKDDWNALGKALKEIHPRRKGADRQPLAVVHPALNVLGITTVYVVSISAPQLSSSELATVRIRCLEWIPQPKPVAKSKPKPISAEQRAANASVTKGRELLLENGQTKVDLGVPPPRDSALSYIETPVYVLGS